MSNQSVHSCSNCVNYYEKHGATGLFGVCSVFHSVSATCEQIQDENDCYDWVDKETALMSFRPIDRDPGYPNGVYTLVSDINGEFTIHGTITVQPNGTITHEL